MSTVMSLFGASEWFLFAIWVSVIVWPVYYALRHKTSLALSLTVGLLLAYLVQVMAEFAAQNAWVGGWLWWDYVLIPNRATDPSWWHTLVSSGFLHSRMDATHVLGNILVIALVGVPLEQRLGARRFATVYAVGLLGGSMAWVAFNATSSSPALGASGAAFGLFGAYLAGWPKDEIPFPMILIRKWPVLYLALFYFGMEVVRAYSTLGLNQPSNVAHMAHFGGFIACYITLPLIARGGPYELGVVDEGPVSSSGERMRLNRIKSVMADLSDAVDPWTARGMEVPRHLRSPLKSLLASSDEPETRFAWMEHLADVGVCPDCESPLGVVERDSGPQLQCSKDPGHLDWPN